MFAKLKHWFLWNINFCKGEVDGVEKPENPVYNWFYTHWLWPWKQNDCGCCNSVRGVIYGIIMGYVIGVLS